VSGPDGLIDTHAHLCDPRFDPDREAVLARAGAGGIVTIVEIADRPAGWEASRSLALSANGKETGPRMLWSCGFHPHYAQEAAGFDFTSMVGAARDPDCVAVGEIGLDTVKSRSSRDDQIRLFREALEVAGELDKPVVIHCREAQADTLRILRSFFGGLSRRDGAAGVIHCFSGDIHFAEGCLDLGFYIGVDGPVTYPSSGPLREVLRQVPLDRIVLETDCPYLPPQAMRGQRNEPAALGDISRKLAGLFDRSPDEIARITSENARTLFRLRRPRRDP